jgi:hypothetical protein
VTLEIIPVDNEANCVNRAFVKSTITQVLGPVSTRVPVRLLPL